MSRSCPDIDINHNEIQKRATLTSPSFINHSAKSALFSWCSAPFPILAAKGEGASVPRSPGSARATFPRSFQLRCRFHRRRLGKQVRQLGDRSSPDYKNPCDLVEWWRAISEVTLPHTVCVAIGSRNRCTTKALQPTCYSYDYSTVTEDRQLFDGSSRFRHARTRLNSATMKPLWNQGGIF